VRNNGINPGGDLTTIVYEGFTGADGLSRVATSLARFFDPEYYRGTVPVFDPAIFHLAPPPATSSGPRPPAAGLLASNEAPYPVRAPAASRRPDETLDAHRIVATSCPTPKGVRRIVMKEGTRYGRPGQVYGFEPTVIHAERCETVEIVLENSDSVRHALMIPGLNPMFMLEFAGPGTRSARFVTPDEDITLDFHCHVPMHEQMGMRGQLVVGRGGAPEAAAATLHSYLHEGEGVVVSVDARKSRLVVDHKEIPGFMAAMVMNYLVTPSELLEGLAPGQKIRFTIDEDRRAIVRVAPLGK
jgi:Cu/Ag efflux protein CusF/plastocyanin